MTISALTTATSGKEEKRERERRGDREGSVYVFSRKRTKCEVRLGSSKKEMHIKNYGYQLKDKD